MKTKIATHSLNALICAGTILAMTTRAQAQNLFVANQAGTIYEISGGMVSTFGTGLADPVSLAVNAQGDVFEASSYSVTEYMPGGGQSTFATINPSFPFNTGPMWGYLAMDGAGNLYADTVNDSIYVFAPNGTPTVEGDEGGPLGPQAMAFDGAGNMFISQFGIPDEVSSCLTENGGTIASGSFGSLACDPQGDLFAANSTGITEFAPGGSPSPFYTGQAGALACDDQGDVYMTSSDGIVEFSPDGTSQGVVIPGLGNPLALAFQPVPEPSVTALGVLAVSTCTLISRFRKKSMTV